MNEVEAMLNGTLTTEAIVPLCPSPTGLGPYHLVPLDTGQMGLSI